MKAFFLTTAAVVLLGFGAFAQEPSAQNYIEVSTQAQQQVTPDEIYLAISLNEADSKGKITVAQQEKEMIKALQGLKLDVEKNLTVQDMNSDLKTYFLRKDNILENKTYTLKVGNAGEMMQVFRALNKIGISDINLTRTAVSDQLQKQVKDQLLTSAARKAKENATILAEAVGSKAGKAIYIQNYYNFSQPYRNFALKSTRIMAAADSAPVEEAVSVEIDKTNISVNVVCRFAIE